MMSTTTPYPPGHAHQQSAFSSPASTSSTSSSKQAGSHTDHPASFRDALVHLEAFPEVREASRLRDDHHIQRALPLMHRAIEVLDTTLGKGTTLADAARYQLALYHIEAGDFGGARDILEALTEDVQMGKNAVKDVVSVRLLLAGSCLLQDRLSAAGAAAEDALTLVETRADAYTDLLARAYGMAGVCDMYGGDWEDAYDRLQKSARISMAPAWQCRSASTLGAFHLYTGQQGGPREALAVWEETLAGLDRPREGDPKEREVGLAEARLWLNLAMVYLGDKGGEEGAKLKDLQKADETASKALKLYEKHLSPQDPRMGPALVAIAQHRHIIGQAVSAEGLFRSVIDLLSTPAALASPQLRYSLYRAQFNYSKLLADWDRRERDAEDMSEKAKRADVLRLHPFVPLSPMMYIEGAQPGEVDFF